MSILINEEHKKNLPIIRIAEIVIENFKNVKHGKIVFNCGKMAEDKEEEKCKSDIMGIYGPNGSGKTAVIDAISILKSMLTGNNILQFYSNCINTGSKFAFLKFTFYVRYPKGNNYPSNGDIRKVEYSFKLEKFKSNINVNYDINQKGGVNYNHASQKIIDEEMSIDLNYYIRPYDEVIKVGGTICGKKYPLKPIVDTTKNIKTVIEPTTKLKELIGIIDEDKIIELQVNKKVALSQDISFIFMNTMQKFFYNNSNYSITYQILAELHWWGLYGLHTWIPEHNVEGYGTFPLFTNNGTPLELIYTGPFYPMSSDEYKSIENSIAYINLILPKLIHDIKIEIKEIGKEIKNGIERYKIELLSVHNNNHIPIQAESLGIRRIISSLMAFIMVFCFDNVTLAYDEFDASIFEYILGELLLLFQNEGKGQFIFTSHNMHPLEVLNKEYIYFATNKENDRYKKINVAKTNNLRKVYYRISKDKDDSNFYTPLDRDELLKAFQEI